MPEEKPGGSAHDAIRSAQASVASSTGNIRDMTLRGLLAGVAVVFIVSAVTFAVLFPGNVDDPDPSPLFGVATWVAVASLVVLVIGGFVALVRR